MPSDAPVVIEFYGVIRLRTGVASMQTTAGTLLEVLRRVQTQFPELAPDYLRDGQAVAHLLVSLDGGPAIDRPELAIQPGTTLVLVSAQSGG